MPGSTEYQCGECRHSFRVPEGAVRDTRLNADRTGGMGLYASGGAQVEVRSAVLERNRWAGALARDEGTVVTLEGGQK